VCIRQDIRLPAHLVVVGAGVGSVVRWRRGRGRGRVVVCRAGMGRMLLLPLKRIILSSLKRTCSFRFSLKRIQERQRGFRYRRV